MKKFFTAKGRMSRRDFWGFYLKIIGIQVLMAVVATLLITPFLSEESELSGASSTFVMLVVLAVIIGALSIGVASIFATIRRLHDINKGGEYYLLSLIPYIGSIILLIFLLLKGDEGSNDYGDSPILKKDIL